MLEIKYMCKWEPGYEAISDHLNVYKLSKILGTVHEHVHFIEFFLCAL